MASPRPGLSWTHPGAPVPHHPPPPGKPSSQSEVLSQISTSWVHLESSLLKGIISLLSPSLQTRQAGSQNREVGRLGLGDRTKRGTKKRGDRGQRAHWALREPRGQGLPGLRSTLQPTSQLRPASPAGLLTPQENPAQHLGAGTLGSGAREAGCSELTLWGKRDQATLRFPTCKRTDSGAAESFNMLHGAS